MICIFVSNWQQQRGGGVRSLISSDPTKLLLPCQARVVPPTHCVEVSKIFRGNYYREESEKVTTCIFSSTFRLGRHYNEGATKHVFSDVFSDMSVLKCLFIYWMLVGAFNKESALVGAFSVYCIPRNFVDTFTTHRVNLEK